MAGMEQGAVGGDATGSLDGGAEASPSVGGVEGGNGGRRLEDAEHEFASIAVVIIVLVLMSSIGFAYIAKKYRFYYLPESAFTMLAGALVGLVAMLVLSGDPGKLDSLRFQPDLFFFLLLPPIILEAGFSLDKVGFMRNFSTIIMFAVLGTLISTFVIGFLVYGFANAGAIGHVDTTDPLQSLLFGALISAVDPVATLSIMGSPELNCDKTLYSLVFGESVLNDAVAIVLFKTFSNLASASHANMHLVGSYFLLIGEFLGISIGSVLVGCAIGLGASFMYKHTNIRKYPSKEIILLFLFAYLAYAVGEAVELSGIMALFFCGIIFSHYNFYNLSPETKEASHHTFKAFAMAAETAVFGYIGIAAFAGHFKTWNGPFIALGILFCLLARALNTFPLSALANMRRKIKIPCKMQFVIWFAGLRGAIAFALALNMPQPEKDGKEWDNDVIVTTTLCIVAFTTIVAGGLTEPILTRMEMRTRPNTDEDQEEHLMALRQSSPSPGRTYSGLHGWWKRTDEGYMKPLFGGEPAAPSQGGAVVYTSSTGSSSSSSSSPPSSSSSSSTTAYGGFASSSTGLGSSAATSSSTPAGATAYNAILATDDDEGDIGSGSGSFFGVGVDDGDDDDEAGDAEGGKVASSKKKTKSSKKKRDSTPLLSPSDEA